MLHWLTHWGQVTHICISELTNIGSDKGLSPGWHQAIIWTNAGLLSIGPIEIEIHIFSFKKMHLNMSSGKRRPFCLNLNALTCQSIGIVRIYLAKLTHCTCSIGVSLINANGSFLNQQYIMYISTVLTRYCLHKAWQCRTGQAWMAWGVEQWKTYCEYFWVLLYHGPI